MAFLDSSLSVGEDIVGRYALHWVNYIPMIRLALVGMVVALVLQSGLLKPYLSNVPQQSLDIAALILYGYLVLRMGFIWLRLRFTELAATNKRVICKTGIWARNTSEMKISSIETVTLRQGIVGRVLNYGSLLVTGKGVSDVLFANISDPMGVKRAIESINDAYPGEPSDA